MPTIYYTAAIQQMLPWAYIYPTGATPACCDGTLPRQHGGCHISTMWLPPAVCCVIASWIVTIVARCEAAINGLCPEATTAIELACKCTCEQY